LQQIAVVGKGGHNVILHFWHCNNKSPIAEGRQWAVWCWQKWRWQRKSTPAVV